MIRVHHLNNSRSHRVLWLLEELAAPYEVIAYQRDPATMLAPPELRRIHPLGKSPVIEDGELVLAESGAIVEYLVGKFNREALKPDTGSMELTQYRYWLHFAEGSAMPPLLLKLYFTRVVPAPAAVMARIDAQIAAQLDFMDSTLSKSVYFAGARFTAADIQMSFPVIAAAARGGLDASRPHLWRWLTGIQQRPAYQRAIARGGALQLS